MTETFKPIADYPDYEVSDLGNVRSFKSGKARLLKPIVKKKKRYQSVALCKGGVTKHRTIHSLVLETFVGPRPEGLVCRHLDDNSLNNCLSNLCWGTQKENSDDAIKSGSHSCLRLRKLNAEAVQFIRTSGASARKLAKRFGVSHTTILSVRKGELYV